MNFYYRVWSELFYIIKIKNGYENWKSIAMTLMTVPMSLNLLIISIVFQKYILGINIYQIDIDFLPSKINAIVNFFSLYIFPNLTINYFLIFYRDRFRKVLTKSKYRDPRKLIFIPYLFFSLIIPLLLVILVIINQ